MRLLRRSTNQLLLTGLISLICVAAGSSAPEIPRQILGIHLQLAKDDVHKRLKEIGSFLRNDRKRQEIWEIRDSSFSHLIVSFGKDGKLRFVTAVAREDAEAKRVAYGEIGNLDEARQAGDPAVKNFNYEWEVAAQNGNPRMLVSARGRDPTFLTTLSFKKMEGSSGDAK